MKYIRSNEAFNEESTDKRRELQEFSNDYLAYLIDDDWSVSVWGFTTSFKIVLISPSSVRNNRIHHDDVEWLSVKNRIIPFVQMLSNRYQLGYEGWRGRSSSIIRIEGTYSDDIHIKDIDQLEDLPDDMLFYSFSIVVKKDGMKHLKMFKESLNDAEVVELKDFCETNLAYLMDEGFEISCDDNKYINLHLPGKSPSRYGTAKDEFYWNDIKDHFIPFLQLLSRRYELKNFGHRPSDYVVLFQGDRNKYATVEQVINDDLPTEVYHNLWSIILKIRNKI